MYFSSELLSFFVNISLTSLGCGLLEVVKGV